MIISLANISYLGDIVQFLTFVTTQRAAISKFTMMYVGKPKKSVKQFLELRTIFRMVS